MSNDIHQITGHHGFMGAFAMTSIAVAAIASLRPVGWRVTAWTPDALPTLLGALSLLEPDLASNLSARWAIAAIAEDVTFVAGQRATPSLRGGPPGSRVGRPRRGP